MLEMRKQPLYSHYNYYYYYLKNAEDFLDLPLEDFYTQLADTMPDGDFGLDIASETRVIVGEDQFIVDKLGNPMLMEVCTSFILFFFDFLK